MNNNFTLMTLISCFIFMEMQAQTFSIPGNLNVDDLIETDSLRIKGGNTGEVLINDGTGKAEWKNTSNLDIFVERSFPLSGDGTFANPLRLNTIGLSQNDGLVWNGSSWGFSTINYWQTGGAGIYYNDGNLSIGTNSVINSYKLNVQIPNTESTKYAGNFKNNSYQTSFTSTTYGLSVENNSDGTNPNGTKIALNSVVLNTNGAGPKYGVRTRISQGGSGVHYGIHARAQGANNFAGYFDGNVAVPFGKIGIGTSTLSTSFALQVKSSLAASFYGDLEVRDFGTEDRLLQVYDQGNTAILEMFSSDQPFIRFWAGQDCYINSSLGIGNTNPAYKLDVTGNAQITGNLQLWSSPTIGSDRRIKTDIAPIEGALEKITQLNGVSYNMNHKAMSQFGIPTEDSSQKRNLGFIAQEVKEVLPEIVVQNQINELNGIQYDAIIPVLVEAIKEQQQIIKELQDRVIELENN